MSTTFPEAQQAAVAGPTAVTPIVNGTIRLGSNSRDVQFRSGQLTLDRRRAQRTTGAFDVLTPMDEDSFDDQLRFLTPHGADLDVDFGVRLIDGSEAVVPAGRKMAVTGVRGSARPGAVISVEVSDRSERVARWRFEQPFEVPPADLALVICEVLNNRGLDCDLDPVGVSLQTARVFGLEATIDPWNECNQLAAGFGYRLWINRNGQPVLDQPPPDDFGPVNDLSVTDPRFNYLGLCENVIVARFEPVSGTPRIAIAEDLDPASPTFVGGPFGRVTFFYVSPAEVSQAGADQAAQSILARRRFQGVAWALDTGWNPTLDPDDRARTMIGNRRVTTLVDATTLRFGPAGASATIEGRERRRE